MHVIGLDLKRFAGGPIGQGVSGSPMLCVKSSVSLTLSGALDAGASLPSLSEAGGSLLVSVGLLRLLNRLGGFEGAFETLPPRSDDDCEGALGASEVGPDGVGAVGNANGEDFGLSASIVVLGGWAAKRPLKGLFGSSEGFSGSDSGAGSEALEMRPKRLFEVSAGCAGRGNGAMPPKTFLGSSVGFSGLLNEPSFAGLFSEGLGAPNVGVPPKENVGLEAVGG